MFHRSALRFVALSLMTTVLHILHSLLARRPAIYDVYNTTGNFNFALMAKTLLRAGTGGHDGSNTFVFSLQPLPISSAVNLENQN